MEKNTQNIIIGLIIIAISIIAFVFPIAFFWIVVILLSVLILIIGVSRIISGLKTEDPEKKSSKFMNIAAGSIVIIMAVLVMSLALADPVATAVMIMLLLAIIFLVIGVSRIVSGIKFKTYAKWLRIVDVIFGIVIVVLAILMFLYLDAEPAAKLVLLSLTMLLAGIIRLLNGIFDKPVVPKEEPAVETAPTE